MNDQEARITFIGLAIQNLSQIGRNQEKERDMKLVTNVIYVEKR